MNVAHGNRKYETRAEHGMEKGGFNALAHSWQILGYHSHR